MSFTHWLRSLKCSLSLRSGVNRRLRSRQRPQRYVQLRLDTLEDRTLLSAYIVNTTADSGPGSLRDAINQVNLDTSHALYASPSDSSKDEIDFQIASAGVQTITPLSALPAITNPVVLDGTTEPGFAGRPLIELNGSSAGAGADGLDIAAGNSTVRGLVINGFTGNGIVLSGPGNDVVAGNYIGTDVTGTVAVPNARDGVLINGGASGNVIGGHAAGNGNLISGNGNNGVRISGAGTSGNQVEGNIIGLDVSGATAVGADGKPLGNGNVIQYSGILINGGATNNTVGGLTSTPGTGAGNVISGNLGIGVQISDGGTSGNVVEGNIVGLDATGTKAVDANGNALGNGGDGAAIINNTTGNTIGGTAPGVRNIISGNKSPGVDFLFTSNNIVAGNFIGTDVTGEHALGNSLAGIRIQMASNNLIGGTVPAARNLISGNYVYGVYVHNDAGRSSTGNMIEGNYIGTDATGDMPLGNASYGIALYQGSNNTTIGGLTNNPGTAPGNIISGNSYVGGGSGILLVESASGTMVEGNVIGLGADGNALGIQSFGVIIIRGATNNIVGGTAPGAGNVISGNAVNGVDISESGTTGNLVQGNIIGLDVSGSKAVGNGIEGVKIFEGATGNTIGGTTAGAGNVISGNGNDGVEISEPGTSGNLVEGNIIGTNPSGATNLGNAGPGVLIENGASNNRVGGTAAGAGNRIAFNGTGVEVLGSSTTGDAIHGNAIHDNTAIGIGLGGTTFVVNDSQGHAGPNLFQDYPVLQTATINASGHLVVSYSVPTADTSATYPLAIDLYLADATGQGETYLASDTYSATDLANGVKSVDLGSAAGLEVAPGDSLVATATDAGGNTSEFSPLASTVTVIPPASLSGTVFEDFNADGQVDFGERGIAGVSIRLTGTDDLGNAVDLPTVTDADGCYFFLHLRPGSYFITETQPASYLQGKDCIGTAGGSLVDTDEFFVQLGAGVNGMNYNYGERPPAGSNVQHGQTATIGFWNNKNGQKLIKALNGGTGHQLADWLAATVPNIFGTSAGANNLAGQSNASVAALFQSDFLLKGVKPDAQVLATALSVYVTNATLDSTSVATQYGFTVSGDGAGTATVNVGSNGDAFGVANNTTLTIMDLLLATNDQAVDGLLYNGNTTKRNHANNVYSAVNQAGGNG